MSFQLGREGAADAQAAAGPSVGLDVASCCDDDVLDDRQAEAGTARGARGVGPEEALEEARQRLLQNAETVVGRRQHREVARASDRQCQAGAVAGVADRVLGEVLDDHSKHPRAQGQIDIGVSFDDQLNPSSRGGTLEILGDAHQDREGGRVPQGDDLAPALEL